MRLIKSILAGLAGAGLMFSTAVQAQIGYLDGPSPIEYGTTLNSSSFTVSSGATVLVVIYGGRTQGTSPGSDPGTPSNMKWNGNAMTRAVSQGSLASTWDDNAVYYLMNPPPGSGSLSASLPTGVNQTWWMAYTLTNVDTNIAVFTGSVGASSASTVNNTVSNIIAGDWAAIASSGSGTPNVALTITVTPTNETVLVTSATANGNADMTFGSVSNLPAGNDNFKTTTTASGIKMVLAEAIFTAYHPAPPAPTLTATAPTPPAQVDLSWTEPANSFPADFILMRGRTSGGPYTDFTNVLSATATNYIDKNVVSGTIYYYVLGAANANGTNFSSEQSAAPAGPPFAPLLGAGASGAGKVTLRWTPSFGATSYLVERSTTSGAETQIATVTTNVYTDSGLANGTTYYYEVQAVDAAGTSAPSDEASAVALGSQWYLFDNFSLDVPGAPLNGQTGSAGLGQGWTNLGGGTPIMVTNNGSFGGANFAQYTSGSVASIGDYESGLGIASNSTAATVFLEFSLPGIQSTFGNIGTNVPADLVAMNFDIDNSSPPGALTGSSTTGPSAQFNYDNSTGFGFFRVLGGNTFYYATISPTNTPYLPVPGNTYYFWFVINAAKGTYQIYLANGSMSGTNLDSGGLGAAPTLMWGTTATNGTGSVITYGFRNVAAGAAAGQPVNYIGTGPGSTLGSVAQNEFANIYVDSTSQNLTNPVTGAAPSGTPQVFSQPQPLQLFQGATATFNIVGSAGVNYQWQKNGVALVDGGNISGSMTSTLTISNVTAADAANYSCIVNNPSSSAFASSTAAALTIVTPNGAFETALVGAGPSHFYAFNDTGAPSTGTEVAYDFAGADNGIYGSNAQNGYDGILGPNPSDGFPGFSTTNDAVSIAGYDQPDNVAIDSSWNLDTNSVTITAWINPSTPTEPSGTAIVLNRGTGTDVEGFTYNGSGNYTLGYTWANDPSTTNWDSGLLPPANQWSFVSLVVTPTNATISLMNTNGILSATHVYPHPVEPFAGTTMIGDDPGSAIGALNFNGLIDEVGIFNQALSQSQLQAMFAGASGLSAFPATNSVTLNTPTPIYPGQTLQFSSVYGGSAPLTLNWQINGTNLTDGQNSMGFILGSATPNLTISNLASADVGSTYAVTLVTSNAFGAYTNDPPVSFTVSAPNAATTIYTIGKEAAGADWNTGSSWSDGNPVSVSIYASPGSTYEIVAGTMERTPISTNAVFPGNILVVDGNGVLVDGNSTNFTTQTTTGELRLKESGTASATNFGTIYTVGGSVTFPDLQLNGGQIDNGTSSEVAINGEIDVLTNSTIYADSAAATSVRSMQINALLTGSGTLTYTFLGTASAYTLNDLVISCPSNTFSGAWNVLQGALVGNAPNSLGTNSITVGVNGALETTYNLVNTNATLTLNGQMYLYTADTFYSLSINGSNMPPGTYTWAQLNSAFPVNFPATWAVQLGSTTGTNTGGGSITVLASLPPAFTQQPASVTGYPGETVQFTATTLYATNYQWWFTNNSNVAIQLTDGSGIFGSQTTTLTVSNISMANEGTYALVATGPGGSATSIGAQLTVLPASGPITISTTEFEAQGTDWNTPASWDDNLAASVSVFANPGSTYQIVPGTLERTPISTNAVFPGNILVIQGDGVLVDGSTTAFTSTSELRLKESGTTVATNFGTTYVQGGTVTFPHLQLNGGQIDNGNASAVAINGEIDVLTNSSIYADGASAGSIRSIQVNALLTGSGTITYTYNSSNYVNNDLIISGSNNTFTGQWNVLQGGLLGNAPNSLGTNSITIETNAMLETTYDLHDNNANLILNGQMYLYRADTFYSMSINGTAVSPGTYSFAQLNSAYPTNFPATWPVQLGSATGTNTGSGSITVLTGPAPAVLPSTISSIALSGGNLTLTGTGGATNGTFEVVTTTNVVPPISWTVVTNGSYSGTGTFSITFPVTPGSQKQFFAIKSP